MAARNVLTRQLQADAVASAQPCSCCGHPIGGHREPPRTLAPTTLAELSSPRPNPAYRPLHFHCGVDGCDCVQVLS